MIANCLPVWLYVIVDLIIQFPARLSYHLPSHYLFTVPTDAENETTVLHVNHRMFHQI